MQNETEHYYWRVSQSVSAQRYSFVGLSAPTLANAKPVGVAMFKTRSFKNNRKFDSCKRTSSERNIINGLKLVFRLSHC